jgi:hypothetical protein
VPLDDDVEVEFHRLRGIGPECGWRGQARAKRNGGQRLSAMTAEDSLLTGQVELVNLLVVVLDKLLFEFGVVLGRVATAGVAAPDLGVRLLLVALLVLVLGEQRGDARPALLLPL